MPQHELPNIERLKAAIAGDQVAQQILFTQYYGLIAAVAWKAWPEDLRHVVSQDDLVQNVILRILKRLNTVNPNRLEEFPGWLAKVAQSEIVDEERYWRAFNHRRITQPVDRCDRDGEGVDLIEHIELTYSLPDKPLRREEAKSALLSAMDALPAGQRDVLYRKYFLDESIEAIAAALERSEGAVRALLSRAERKLAKQMGAQSLWLSSG